MLCLNFEMYATKYKFDGGTYTIEKINGIDDLENMTIEYDNGDIFVGKGTRNGYPLYGSMTNVKTNTYYCGGFDNNEQYTGEGTLETRNSIYRGNFKNGKKNGYGKLYDKVAGTTYEGNWLNDVKSGEGKLSNNNNYFYNGSWSNDKFNGKGTLYSNGEVYEGNFVNGSVKGNGKLTNSNGSIIEGYWENKTIVSGENCSYLGIDGSKYSGGIEKGKFDGAGIYTDSKGNVYEGSFSENQRTGIGQQVYSDGSEYSGYLFGNQRNGMGTMKFSNGYQYEGGFLNGNFQNSGYLLAEENQEEVLIYSDEWNGSNIPEDSEFQSTYDNYSTGLASNILPKKGKLIFSDGDMYEGYLDNGYPIAGLGIWTTREERLAKINSPEGSKITLVAYKSDKSFFDYSSVYSEHEIRQITQSPDYLASFNTWYKKHKATIDKVVQGLQVVATVLSILPSPIQPIAAGIDIALSAVQISLKTVSTSMDVYDACVAGNKNLVPGMLKDYGKDIAWDVVNILLGGSNGKIVGKLGEKVTQGLGQAGKQISKVVTKAVSKSKVLQKVAGHLDDLAKLGKNASKTVINSITNSGFYKWVAKNGGKVTQAMKTGWVKIAYPALAKYGDDGAKLIFKYGNDIAEQLGKNGDLILKAIKSNGDDVARLFIKYGDDIAKVAKASGYPDDVIKFIKNCNNTEEAIKIVSKNPSIGKIVSKYGDDAIKCIERYGDDAIRVFEKNGDLLKKSLKYNSILQQKYLIEFIDDYPDLASKVLAQNNYKLPDYVDSKCLKELKNNNMLKESLEYGTSYSYTPKQILDKGLGWARDLPKSAKEALMKDGVSPKVIENALVDKNGNLIVYGENMTKAGQIHNGVRFEHGYMQSGGYKLDFVAPKFPTKFEITVPVSIQKSGDKKVMEYCTSQLREELIKNPNLKKTLGLNDTQVQQIMNGNQRIENFTWHHDAFKKGNMQLVDSSLHSKVGHIGGDAIWGGGVR